MSHHYSGPNITFPRGDARLDADSAPLSAKLLRNGTLKTYKGFPHGVPTTGADTINPDILAFIKQSAARPAREAALV